ncbi:acyltransferase family protein [Pseudobacteriovorax antillogorgiicola]|uniref:Acyltransferase family protein n=1 Tax=Pseudobacteriovorax antillogorgiicola TaxID=1513793 RepID=A0A1Y6CDK7_9BACT|nr:acyltransferase [Pseudobacteriovorax antillogorgiicola]TCS47969.1 acyltransferase-like protein [Pseudobacteriovorax antillogorgiicola]SMF58220.1 Acyltransferase family protein [Pseudobacteriovorax antillogorgiicola]
MSQRQSSTLFFSNVRYLMVMAVVVFHSGRSLESSADWWYVMDQNPAAGIDVLNRILQTFQLPVLFFIAGYFVLPSLRKKTLRDFWKDKWRRLGYPMIFGAVLVISILHYAWNFRAHSDTNEIAGMGFLEYWLMVNADFFNLRASVWDNMNSFSYGHLWYLSFLLCLFLLAGFLWKISGFRTFFSQSRSVSSPKIFLALALVLLINTGVPYLLCQFMSESTWYLVIPILEFQPTRSITYISFFFLGMWASRHLWFKESSIPGPWIFWVGASLTCLGIFVWVGENFKPESLTYLLSRASLSLSLLVTILITAQKFWNQQTFIDKQLAQYSYEIYLGHYVFCLALQLLLAPWQSVPTTVKLLLISSVTLILSLLVSKFLIQPRPRLTLAMCALVNIGLMAFTG